MLCRACQLQRTLGGRRHKATQAQNIVGVVGERRAVRDRLLRQRIVSAVEGITAAQSRVLTKPAPYISEGGQKHLLTRSAQDQRLVGGSATSARQPFYVRVEGCLRLHAIGALPSEPVRSILT